VMYSVDVGFGVVFGVISGHLQPTVLTTAFLLLL